MRSIYSTLLLCTLILFGVVLVGCNQSVPTNSADEAVETTNDDVPSNTVNGICPIMGGKVASDGGTAEWDGKLIGFCCPGCEPKWAKFSDDEKSEKLAATRTKAEGDAL